MEPYQKLEKEYAKFVGSKHAVSCSSGTAALHLALLSLGVGKGDEVILPDFTMAACAFAVSYIGAKPVFVDVDPNTYGLDPKQLKPAITSRTKAIIVVHVYGRLADMSTILRIAKQHGLPVIEDACEAQGAVYKSRANITVYSFYRNKIIPAEEGGIITTDNKKIADNIRYLKNMAFSSQHDYFHADIGYNYRMTNASAALALQNLKKYSVNNKKRRIIEKWYSRYLERRMLDRDAVWFYELHVPPWAKDKILNTIPAARHSFKPLSSFPMYGSRIRKSIASQLSSSIILLPAYPSLTEKEVKDICKKVNDISLGNR